MRKMLLAMTAAAVALPTMTVSANAQDYRGDRYERRDDRRDYRYDRRDDRRDYRYDRRSDRRDYRYDRRNDNQYARYYDSRGYYSGPTWRGNDGRYYCRRSDGTTGLIIGGVAGALLGGSIDSRGDNTAGVLIGGVIGALVGKSVDQGGDRGRRCR